MPSAIRSLVAVDGDQDVIRWNTELGHLEVGTSDSTRILLLTSRPYFSVTNISFSPIKNLLALSGDNGVTIVQMPRRWATRYTNDRDAQMYCKTYNLDERLFRCEKRLRVLETSWHPYATEKKQVVVVLTNDNRLRFYDVIKNEEIQSINLRISSEFGDRSIHEDAFSMSMINKTECAVTFDFAPAIIVQKPETLWPIYILTGTGEILLIYTNLRNKTYTEHIIGPLPIVPPSEDCYFSDACSLIVLDTSPTLIAVATTNGRIYHLFAFLDDSSEILPKQTLYLYDTVELAKELIENPDDPYTQLPIRLFKDSTSDVRYFCIHQNGVHTIVLPILEDLQLEGDIDQEKESFSEYIICTRTQIPSYLENNPDDPSTPRGLGVEIRKCNIALIVLMGNNEIITQRISPATAIINRKRFPRNANNTSWLSNGHESVDVSQIDATRSNFEEQIQQILKRKANVPVLKLSEERELSDKTHDLLRDISTIFQSEYIKKYDLAAEAIKKKLGILEKDMKNQKLESSKVVNEKKELYVSIIALRSKADAACARQKDLLRRFDRVIANVTKNQPDLDESQTNFKRQLEEMNEKIKFYRDKLDSAINKHKYHISQADASIRENSNREIPQVQLNKIRETLAKQGAEITELKRILKSQRQRQEQLQKQQ